MAAPAEPETVGSAPAEKPSIGRQAVRAHQPATQETRMSGRLACNVRPKTARTTKGTGRTRSSAASTAKPLEKPR
ncbi:MAG: hypothetical protein V9H25_01290 [Candidatus Competibacter sp.]